MSSLHDGHSTQLLHGKVKGFQHGSYFLHLYVYAICNFSGTEASSNHGFEQRTQWINLVN